MPRFFLHICNSEIVAEDEEGHELPDLATARHRAIADIRCVLAEELKGDGKIDLNGEIKIEDEDHHLVAVVPFRSAVEIRG